MHVLANGCTDGTAERARLFDAPIEKLHIHEIEMGDKANAWNFFTHEICQSGDFFVFLDGDCWIKSGSILSFSKSFIENPRANAAIAHPSHKKCEWPLWTLHGNLYALSGQFMRRLREQSIRLPFGLVGDDSFVGHLALLDLNPNGSWDTSKLAQSVEAGFYYDPPNFLSATYYFNQYKRKIRYARRAFENKMLEFWLKERGLGALPGTTEEIYAAYAHRCGLQWKGVDTLFDWISLRHINLAAANQANLHELSVDNRATGPE